MVMYFIDKAMPFGASISCRNFQRFSNALKHIVERLNNIQSSITNYLDDFLFIHYLRRVCNQLLQAFLNVCARINFPVALEKTVWASEVIEFLGVLLNGRCLTLAITQDKIIKALNQIQEVTCHRKITVKHLQKLSETLNFFTRAIVPGRTFTRRIYNKFAVKNIGKNNVPLRQYHHVSIDAELQSDCKVWEIFLEGQSEFNRPFIDFRDPSDCTTKLAFYTDASKPKIWDLGVTSIMNGSLADGNQTSLKKKTPALHIWSYMLCVWQF